jgi:hypothetical protein
MTFDTPHLAYILVAYGISLAGLFLFMLMSFLQWNKSIKQLENPSRET